VIAVQVPSPELAKEIGVVGYLLIVLVLGGLGLFGYFLRRMASGLDVIAAAQVAGVPLLSEMKTLLETGVRDLNMKLDRIEGLSQEHVRIARKWEDSEALGRVLKVTERGRPSP
jgi:formate-dependent phosphoribosylglycinamide formyltransferase (GAR transformylase)